MQWIAWICQQDEFKPNWFRPHIESLRGTIGNFPNSWSITDAKRAFKYALGVAYVTDAQLASIQADGSIRVLMQTEFYNQFDQLSGVRRVAIRAFLTNAGVILPPNNEVLRDLWDRITQSVDNKPLTKLIDELIANNPDIQIPRP